MDLIKDILESDVFLKFWYNIPGISASPNVSTPARYPQFSTTKFPAPSWWLWKQPRNWIYIGDSEDPAQRWQLYLSEISNNKIILRNFWVFKLSYFLHIFYFSTWHHLHHEKIHQNSKSMDFSVWGKISCHILWEKSN